MQKIRSKKVLLLCIAVLIIEVTAIVGIFAKGRRVQDV